MKPSMRYVDEFRDPVAAKAIIEKIHTVVESIPLAKERPLQIMEVCGGHTHAIFRYGLESLLPKEIEWVHGPGCPVCVLPMGRVDDCVAIAEQPNVIFTTFGDAMRVPGSRKSLLQAKAEGADIRMVYSPMDALALARQNPDKRVVFFGLGFETTMPSTALTLQQAKREGISNFYLFCNHITIIPTLQAILDDPDLKIDGFLGPGHVSMIIGEAPYRFIAERYQRPLVIAGFEPLDVLQALLMLLEQMRDQRCTIENQYTRIVQSGGNNPALTAVQDVFELRETFEWRGLGEIEHSGVQITQAYAAFDAERAFAYTAAHVADPEACHCGEVLKGQKKPWQCDAFGQTCTPQTPIGALMVSTEGACSAYYNYGKPERRSAQRIEATAL
jgi:hydrogenase expression/formation protein HypD